MINLKDVISLDFAYLETFTKRIDTSWGSIFCNENQPNYYTANHAHISDTIDNPKLIIDEVKNFFNSRKIIPRFYIYNLDDQKELVDQLILEHFGFEELIGPVQLWDQKVLKKEKRKEISIELVTKENYSEALNIECSITEFGGKAVREKAFEVEFNHPSFIYYLLRCDGVACATACIFIHDYQARMESVATLGQYRGRGLIGELIHYIQGEVDKKGLKNLWVFPINEKIEKVYQKYGFKTVAKLKMGHAFLGGRSIKEIQGDS
ncbi:GNAT family N-acetyltransferase [Neobacillus cucumis]|uniref:GNAT family N-acetyltransferase n=1 Tax=Neobacillus cucumis TaxID=1740721 RepID=UPI0019655CE2|nr:GNAT family N-acetyltransferase [Neobacillus cucumis]MBM7653467.1 N-acetylglutamate synthase-like GNAT family acetyltransferase [Neobacillus cucumis]